MQILTEYKNHESTKLKNFELCIQKEIHLTGKRNIFIMAI